VPVSNPCVTYCNLFIFQIKNREPYFVTSLSHYHQSFKYEDFSSGGIIDYGMELSVRIIQNT
jgi:hypothetical protein